MNRTSVVIGLSLTTSALAVFAERDAAACGGCFHPPTQMASDITDERMLLCGVDDADDALRPDPVCREPDVLRVGAPDSRDGDRGPERGRALRLGRRADRRRRSRRRAELPAPPALRRSLWSRERLRSAAAGDAAAGAVTVTKPENVGPYATVQLHATDSGALDSWLAQNGFDIPADVVPVIDAYVTEGFDFLAMKLLPNQGVQAMRPVRVTTPGASLSLPLRMAAVGTGATVGITIWVVSDGRYEPQNFPFFHIDDSALVWDFSTSSSNYTTLRAQNEAALGGKGWEIESSIDLNQQLITNVILSGGQYYGRRLRRPPRLPGGCDASTICPSGARTPAPTSAAYEDAPRKCARRTSRRSSRASADRTCASRVCGATSRTRR